ncbi:MAG TPA: hypothetical protein PK110_02625 [Niabella sp.]|jgi:hypothetical protein|nr:hypothetical protein [Chitinophagaceae bacterium]HRO83696.1 hypothetical protein [Niabella sp.]
MKKSITISSIIILLVIGILSCQKQEIPVNEETVSTQQFAGKSLFVNEKGESEGAIIVGSNDELKAAFDNKEGYMVRKASQSNNIFLPVGPVTPADPFKGCWKEIKDYYNAHYSTWLAQANATCRDVLVCLTCPNAGGGLYVLYVIKPTSIKCKEALAAWESIKEFNIRKANYDSPEVADFIRKLK